MVLRNRRSSASYFYGIVSLISIPLLGLCCTTPQTPVYSRVTGNPNLQFSITPPTDYEVYEVRTSTNVPKLRVTYIGGPSTGTVEIDQAVSTFTGDTSTGNLSFTLKNVQLVDNGVYRLVRDPDVLQCQTLYIIGKPTTPTMTSNTEPTVGESVTLTCISVSITSPSGHGLNLSYSWTVDGTTNPTGSKYTYSTSRNTITVSPITKNDGKKVFTCMATEVVTGGLTSDASSTRTFNVIYGPDTVTLTPNTVSYTEDEGTSVPNIRCSADCNPPCTYRWMKQGQTAAVSTNGTFAIGTLQKSFAGTYTCTATHPQNAGTQTVQLEIIVRYAPDLTISLSSNALVEGNTIQLKCNAAGVPSVYKYNALTQTWGGTTMPNTRLPILNTALHSSLQFTKLRLEDTGTYTCHVNNGVNDVNGILDQTASVVIQVKVPPKILTQHLQFAVSINDAANITILFYSYPAVSNVTLMRQCKTAVTDDSRRTVSYMTGKVKTQFYGVDIILNGNIFTFEVTHVLEEDLTNYTLILQNEVSIVETVFMLIQESKPLLPKAFRYFGLIDGVPLFYWEKNFNGGHKQYFVIETTTVGTTDWSDQIRVDEENSIFYLQPMYTYIANITGLPPGQYIARLKAENKLGMTEDSARLRASFTIPAAAESLCLDTQPMVGVIVGAIGGSIAVVVIVVVALVVILRTRYAKENASQSDQVCSSLCKRKTNEESNRSRQNTETFSNTAYEEDKTQTEKADGTYENEMRVHYETLNREDENNTNYDSLTQTAGDMLKQGTSTEYENL